MKNTFNKKVISVVVLLISFFSVLNIANAFKAMDVCNYTNWDTSWNYYDGICTKDGKESENEEKVKKALVKKIDAINSKKVEKIHALKEVKHYNGSSSSFSASHFLNVNSKFITNNSKFKKNNIEIEKLKSIIKKQDVLLKKYKEENSRYKEILKKVLNKKVSFKKWTKIIKKYKNTKIKETLREKILRRNAEILKKLNNK